MSFLSSVHQLGMKAAEVMCRMVVPGDHAFTSHDRVGRNDDADDDADTSMYL